MMRSSIVIILVIFCAGCVNSPDINTPREIINEGRVSSSAFSINTRYNNHTQVMQLIDNLFECEVHEGSAGPVVSLRVELQNVAGAGNYLNSVYFRADALPADGAMHSLSGDPTTTAANAAKLLLFEDNKLTAFIPLQQTGMQDNFLVSVTKAQGKRQLLGSFSCTAMLTAPPRQAVVAGEFTISY